MDTHLRPSIVRFILTLLAGLRPEDSLGIHAVDFGASSRRVLAKGVLEGFVPGFPGDDLRIRASQVHVEDNVTRVRDEELADGGEGDICT